MDDSPFGDDGFLHLQLNITMPNGLLASRIVSETFTERHRKSLKTKPPSDPTWRELERHFKPFVAMIRRTRREIERRYSIQLPARCLVLNIRRGHNARGPIVAEIDEEQIRVYRRA